jgi:colanic acid biosynthesis protein WcaH
MKTGRIYLEPDIFKTVVQHTPLVSIDLIVRNGAGDVLLGKRRNRPAQGVWFVPGGRVGKDETLNAAFLRLTEVELGQAVQREAASFVGVFEHFYDDNFHGTDFSTHYVVLAYQLSLPHNGPFPEDQHEAYAWFSPAALLADDRVHTNSKAYLIKSGDSMPEGKGTR